MWRLARVPCVLRRARPCWLWSRRPQALTVMTPFAIHAFNPGPMTGDGNWTWLIRGRVPTLIDAGTGDPRHLDGVEQALDGATLAQVLVTHGARRPRVRRAGARRAISRRPLSEDAVARARRPMAGAVGAARRRRASSRPATTRLRAVHTPGHAPDHLCFWHDESRDAVLRRPRDRRARRSTSRRICRATWPPTWRRSSACCALRAGAAAAGARSGHRRSRALLRGYIEHRREREEQIVAALRAGDATPDAIVAAYLSRAEGDACCRWRARACSRTCSSSNARARASRARRRVAYH